jgi:hypothetical protein
MSLTKRYLRDGKNRIIGSITSGYSDTSTVVRVSINSSDPGLLIRRKK